MTNRNRKVSLSRDGSFNIQKNDLSEHFSDFVSEPSSEEKNEKTVINGIDPEINQDESSEECQDQYEEQFQNHEEKISTSPILKKRSKFKDSGNKNLFHESLPMANLKKYYQHTEILKWFILIIPVLICLYWLGYKQCYKALMGCSRHDYHQEIGRLKVKFPSQSDEFWSVVYSGIHNVVDCDSKFKSTVLLFLCSKDTDNISVSVSREIANIAATSLGTNGPIILTEQEINALPTKRGYFIDHYRKSIEEHKVLVFPDLQKIPSHVAEALHFVCDSENPLVQKSVIILTLDITDSNNKKFPIMQVEETLQKLWSPPLTDNIIEPVITRLTTSVVMVQK